MSYHGWQIQDDVKTVQEQIETDTSLILKRPIKVVGCGRTDQGVHARNYYAHFDSPILLPPNFLYRINQILPASIAIHDLIEVKSDSHARFDATHRTYKYFVHGEKDPFLNERSFYVRNYQPNVDYMNKAAELLLGKKNFRIFEKKGGGSANSMCEVFYAKWEAWDENQIVFTITANRFLRNMVRRIVAVLLMIGLDRMTIKELDYALNNNIEPNVTLAVPAYGLFLWDVKYPFIK